MGWPELDQERKRLAAAHTASECVECLRRYFDNYYFHVDRVKQAKNYEKMQIAFIETLNRIAEIEGAMHSG